MSSDERQAAPLLFASESEPGIAVLIDAVRATHPALIHATRPAAGLALMCQRPHGAPLPLAAICCGPMAGLAAASLAKALRALPGCAPLPLILVDEEPPPDWTRCATLPRPLAAAALLDLLATDPTQWSTARTAGPAADTTPQDDDALLDVQLLRRSYAGNPAGQERLLSIFRADLEREMATLSERAEAGEHGDLARAAHRLAGAAGTLGAAPLTQALRALERAADRADENELGSAIASLHSAGQRLLDLLARGI